MTDAVYTARPPGGEQGPEEELNALAEPTAEHEPADSCELRAGLAEDGSETAGPAERPGGRRKGLPWTEAEHRDFLLGLQKLGKGDWRGISRHYVVTRTPTQVASHAQKHFIRQQTLSKRKRRHSLFDITGEEEEAQPDAVAEAHPQGMTTGAQPQPQQQQPQQQQPQAQAGQPQQYLLQQAMQQMPQFPGGSMPGAGMPGYGYRAPMQAAAAAQGWNPNGGFMAQPQQFPNYFQMAQQQQAAAGAMFLAQQQHQQQQVAMAAFMQQHGYGASAWFGPHGFGGQGFGFGAPGMVHMLPHYQQAMFSQPSANASMHSSGTVNPAVAMAAPPHAQPKNGDPAADGLDRQPSQQLPPQLAQQQQQQPQRGNVAFASGQLASRMGSNAGSWLGNGSAHGSAHGSNGSRRGSNQGSRHGSSPEGEGHGSGSGNGSGGSGNGSGGSGNGSSGSGDGSGTDVQTSNGARQQPRKQGGAPQNLEQEPQQPPPEGHGAQAKAHTPFADAPEQAAGGFGHGRLYRPTASHALPSHSLSALPLFVPDGAAGDAAEGASGGASHGNDALPPAPQNPPAAAPAPHNAPHSAFMRPLAPPRAAYAKGEEAAQNGGGGSGSGNSTAYGGRRSHGSGDGSGNSSSQNKGSQRSSGTGLCAANGGGVPAQHSVRATDAAATNTSRVPVGGTEGGKRPAPHSAAAPNHPKRARLGSPPPASAFEATPALAAAAQQRRG